MLRQIDHILIHNFVIGVTLEVSKRSKVSFPSTLFDIDEMRFYRNITKQYLVLGK